MKGVVVAELIALAIAAGVRGHQGPGFSKPSSVLIDTGPSSANQNLIPIPMRTTVFS